MSIAPHTSEIGYYTIVTETARSCTRFLWMHLEQFQLQLYGYNIANISLGMMTARFWWGDWWGDCSKTYCSHWTGCTPLILTHPQHFLTPVLINDMAKALTATATLSELLQGKPVFDRVSRYTHTYKSKQRLLQQLMQSVANHWHACSGPSSVHYAEIE